MRPSPLHLRPRLMLLALALAFPAAVLAQTAAAPAPATPPAAGSEREALPADRHNQKIEHITVEDAGSRVDEVRVGGQTQSITVQPKVGDVPAYEVQPVDGVRQRSNARDDGNNVGQRVWNVIKF